MLKIKLISILVDDQEKALGFYTEILGFLKQQDIPLEKHRWLTVVPPYSDEIEIVLEPAAIGFAKTYQRSLYDAGIPITAFATDDIELEYERLSKHGVEFKTKPHRAGAVSTAVFDDTCGNYVQVFQVHAAE